MVLVGWAWPDNDMARLPRDLIVGFCHPITVRCNNREFRLIRDECREILLYAIDQCQEKQGVCHLCALTLNPSPNLGRGT